MAHIKNTKNKPRPKSLGGRFRPSLKIDQNHHKVKNNILISKIYILVHARIKPAIMPIAETIAAIAPIFTQSIGLYN